jgi:MSHA biogenesis protein MshM
MFYLSHFGLREAPFGITPDTSFFYDCASIQEALNTLVVAVANGEGFIKITGEVGTGKTLLCRKFLATLDDNWVTAYVPNPNLKPRSLMLAFAEELGVKLQSDLDEHLLVKELYRALLDFARKRKRVVVCLDETQAMPLETLETLRLLTNLETEKRKLLQVVMFGQPELDARLSQDSVRQLRQRITFQHSMRALTRDESGQYIGHRLAVAGYKGEPLFTRQAVSEIHRASGGVPRLINVIANKALMLAFGEGKQRVTWGHARYAVGDTPASSSLPAAWLWISAACLAGTGAGWFLLR